MVVAMFLPEDYCSCSPTAVTPFVILIFEVMAFLKNNLKFSV